VRNFPIQSTASEVLHVACILAERRGIPIIATIHDALVAEVDLDHVGGASTALDRIMRDASAVVLRGYELCTEVQLVCPGGRFFDKNGLAMWNTVSRLLTRLEARTA
jgi:DNA polymerase-1